MNMNRTMASILAVISLATYSWATKIMVAGTLATSATWNSDTVAVTGDVRIDSGVTITINRRVRVEFTGLHSIRVKGAIRASGAEPDPVRFTAVNTVKTGWRGIVFDSMPANSDSSIFRYCVFTGAKRVIVPDTAGGALLVRNFSKLLLSRCSFIGDSGFSGGAIALFDSSAVRLDHCEFNGCRAYNRGGAICISGGSSAIIDTATFAGCRAFNQSTMAPVGYGGAVYVSDRSSVALTECNFSNNFASSGGGIAIMNGASAIINSCGLFGNSGLGSMGTGRGGAVYAFAAAGLTVRNCRFGNSDCNAREGGYGGAIYDTASSPVIQSCSFERCVVSGNTKGKGGALFTAGSLPVIAGCLFTRNVADSGSAIFTSNSSPAITNCTFAGDSISSNRVICNSGNSLPVITNSILWNAGTEIFNIAPAYATIMNSCVRSGSYPPGMGNISSNPLFLDTANGKYSLQAGSPCVNAGAADTAGLFLSATDLAGNPRIAGGRIDMGAYETMSTGVTRHGIRRKAGYRTLHPQQIVYRCDLLGRCTGSSAATGEDIKRLTNSSRACILKSYSSPEVELKIFLH